MTLLVAPLLFIAVIVYVAYPLLFESGESVVGEQVTSKREGPLKRKDELVATLKDIEMDFRMGKLSETDYQSLKSEFEHRAVKALQQLESLKKVSKPSRARKRRS
ncbi:MAG: hypothetical protein ACE5JX_10605 [Acidobacteriota bacterium]